MPRPGSSEVWAQYLGQRPFANVFPKPKSPTCTRPTPPARASLGFPLILSTCCFLKRGWKPVLRSVALWEGDHLNNGKLCKILPCIYSFLVRKMHTSRYGNREPKRKPGHCWGLPCTFPWRLSLEQYLLEAMIWGGIFPVNFASGLICTCPPSLINWYFHCFSPE